VNVIKTISSSCLAAASNSFSAIDPLSVKRTATSLFWSILPYKSSADSNLVVGGPVFLTIQFTILSSVLPPVYSAGVPLVKNFILGNPVTPYFVALSLFSVASILAIGIGGSLFLRVLAALAYSGASFLQWPHHGA